MLSNQDWPILAVFSESSSDGYRKEIWEIMEILHKELGCSLITVDSCKSARQIFLSRADFSCVIVCISEMRIPCKEPTAAEENISVLLREIFSVNEKIPVILFTEDFTANDLSEDFLEVTDEFLCVRSGTSEALAGRISHRIRRYLDSVCPKFLRCLTEYAGTYRYAWHTPGHMGGEGFLKSPAGAAFYKFYGENTLRSDLSISVAELGSLLDHSGPAGAAEKTSAQVFGADITYYVLNGTSSANQIIWSSQVSDGDTALLDRNCHKSLYHAMVRTRAKPVYMIPRRNGIGIIGPVRLSEFSHPSVSGEIAMMALTNSTYDGLCYNVQKILKVMSRQIQRVHFDEAWFAYASFHPIYQNHYGLYDEKQKNDSSLCNDSISPQASGEESLEKDGVQEKRPLIFCSQSTHKLLTALSQASMLHIRNGSRLRVDPAVFNESYLMYSSTSPQYSMIASLDTATKMMRDQGYQRNHQAIRSAVELRKKIAENGKKEDLCTFGVWQPEFVVIGGKKILFEEADTEYLTSHQEPWILSPQQDWHGFSDIEENYVMLDPIKVTVTTPGADKNGRLKKSGIPALIVSRFLSEYGIVCEKADYYSFLILNSIGVDQTKQSALLASLSQFRRNFRENISLGEILPGLVEKWPDRYEKLGLADHCRQMHCFFRETQILFHMHRACEEIPERCLTPAEAYGHIVRGSVEFVDLEEIGGRTAASVVAPYPPGIPVVMGGERIDADGAALKYLKILQQFENEFPGYGGSIHGAELVVQDGRKHFRILCVRE